MMFASKTPRDLNHDPVSVLFPDGARTDGCGWLPLPNDGIRLDPRPEFDHDQHNEPNPILVRLRESRRDPLGYVQSADVSKIDIPFSDATPAQIDHARKVLTRLAALS